MDRYIKYGIGAVGFFLVLAFTAVTLYFVNFNVVGGVCLGERCFSTNGADWGAFGSLMGGVFTFVAALGAMATLLFLISQQKQMARDAVISLDMQRRANECALKTTEIQAKTLELSLQIFNDSHREQAVNQYMMLFEQFKIELNEIELSAGGYFFKDPKELFFKLFGSPLTITKRGDMASNCTELNEQLIMSQGIINQAIEDISKHESYSNARDRSCKKLLKNFTYIVDLLGVVLEDGEWSTVRNRAGYSYRKNTNIFKVDDIDGFIKLLNKIIFRIQRLFEHEPQEVHIYCFSFRVSCVLKGYIEAKNKHPMSEIGYVLEVPLSRAAKGASRDLINKKLHSKGSV